MKRIKPELIEVQSVKVLKSNIETSDSFLANPHKPNNIDIDLGQESAFNTEHKNVRIRLHVVLNGLDEEEKEVGLRGAFILEFHIHVENLEEFINVEEELKSIDIILGGTLMGIAYSTARGILLERTQSTYFEGVLLPVISPNTLVKKSALK